MNTVLRLTIVAGCVCLCVVGATWHTFAKDPEMAAVGSRDGADSVFGSEYRYTASVSQPEPTWKEIEELIRPDAATKAPTAKLEFHSLKMERGSALVQVALVAQDGAAQSYIYTLVPVKGTWKVQSSQRLWFVPRSKLLRGVQA